MAQFPSILDDEPRRQPLIILQSSLAQSSLPILRSVIVGDEKRPCRNVLFCLLYPPLILADPSSPSSVIYDWLDRVPGYRDHDTRAELLATAETLLQESSPVNIIIDSIDTLLSDNGPITEAYNLLSSLYALIKKHGNSRLVLHTQSPSPLIPLITTTSFSSPLTHLIAHPPSLLHHLSSELFVLPPPLSPPPKFWSVFIPISERTHDTESLVFGPRGEGGIDPSEVVIELIVRQGNGRKRGVERVLKGWSSSSNRCCELAELETLKDMMTKHKEHVAAPDPTQNLPFNLTLTSSQQESRAQVPLPYAHEGKAISTNTPSTIFYDPDSADDIDDDDPDEDLDI